MTATSNDNAGGDAGTPMAEPLTGERLRAARKELGLSFKAMCAATRIAPRYLAAIENADYERLPADAYTRGYLREYARRVGLDPAETTTAFFRERGRRPQAPRGAHADPHLAEPVRDSPATGAFCMLVAIVLVVGLFCALTGWNPLASVTGGPRGDAATGELAYHPAPPETTVEINAKSITLEARFLKDTEVRLQLDSETVQSATYVRASKANWEANSFIRIEFAKPQSAELRVNGRPLGFPNPRNGQYRLSLKATPAAS